MTDALHHHVARMVGRDPRQQHRSATPLELLFDLTFVIAFGTAANELAHFLVEDHVRAGLIAFGFASFAISWAWINFTWFASAYDTDDWLYRVATLVQMVGVLVLALGLPDMFDSIEHGEHVDNRVMVLGYVIMRVPMLFQWARTARQDPSRRDVAMIYILSIVVSQIGWCGVLVLDLSIGQMFAVATVPFLIEVSGPVVAESRRDGTPWHPHHIAERYGLLVIIALGEGLIGTMATLGAVVGPHGPGWSVDVAVLGLSGTALTFGMWWMYFVVPCGDILQTRRERSFGWGYGHIPLFAAVVAVGAGLHAAAFYIEHHSELDTTATVLTVAVPLAAYIGGFYLMYSALTRSFDPFHVLLLAGSAGLLVLPVVLARSGGSLEWCLALLALAPWVTVVGYEAVGHRHNAEVLARMAQPS